MEAFTRNNQTFTCTCNAGKDAVHLPTCNYYLIFKALEKIIHKKKHRVK